MSDQETPPRVWGRYDGDVEGALLDRNTPTGVGKMGLSSTKWPPMRKHPHRCGEDPASTPPSYPPQETPPRVWGRYSSCLARLGFFGNTPTGVGKICVGYRLSIFNEKHPHGCGEDLRRI